MGWRDAPLVTSGGWQSAPLVTPEAPPAAAPATPPAADAPLNWSDVPGRALANAPASLGNFLSDIAQPILHPIDTASAIKNVGQGYLEKAGLMSGDAHAQYADAVNQYFAN